MRMQIKRTMYHYLTTDPQKISEQEDFRLEIEDMVDAIIDCAKSEVISDTQFKIKLIAEIKEQIKSEKIKKRVEAKIDLK